MQYLLRTCANAYIYMHVHILYLHVFCLTLTWIRYILFSFLGSYGARTLCYSSLEASLRRRHIDAKVGHSSQNEMLFVTHLKLEQKAKAFMYNEYESDIK